MADTNTNSTTKRLAIVTGANKGIGLEICRQLALNGVAVVLTARDEKRGVDAVEKLKKESGLSDVVFRQLDVKDPDSIASLSHFIQTQFGVLDILVNNAAVTGIVLDDDAYGALMPVDGPQEVKAAKLRELARQTYETAGECLQANYYGTKKVTEALLPILQLSNSPRIVNVSSSAGKLQHISHTWAKEVLSDVDGLTEERVDEALNKFLKDEGLIENHRLPAYCVSKAALNAYTRILSKNFPKLRINYVCPGSIKSDLNYNIGKLTAEEGAEGPVKLALLTEDGPSGLFCFQKEVTSFD